MEDAAQLIMKHSCILSQTEKNTEFLSNIETCGLCNYSRNFHSEKIIL